MITAIVNREGRFLMQATDAAGLVAACQYDKYGNQTKLIDPDAGTNDYHYNAFGELTYQKDANNNVFTMLYNNKGQLTNKNCNNSQFSITYAYYANGMLQKETLGNSNSKEYLYDSLGQLTTMNEKIDGATYTHEYTYNNRGKVLTYKYPGGYTITNEYDAYGYKTGVKQGSTYIWKLQGSDYINEMGQIKEYLLGPNNIKTKREYNSNFELTGINTKKSDNTALFDYTYVFDHNTGNLTSRKDNTRNLTESFGYDTQQRLETAKKNNVSTLSIDYYNNGNIDIKSDAGTYAYLSNKPHAVTQITQNNNSMIHPLAQQITYNPFQKTATIEESNYSYAITYGADQQRTKTVLKNNNTVVETRIYSGLYEKYTAGSSTKELHYIPTPSGTVAVHIKTNGGAGTTYYLLKDHLGSIMKVVDAAGNEKEEHSYDAWGNHRNPVTWALSDFSSTLGIRGYTGHEHLPYFQLVNMNGRMYDPVLGRMLSPDNFVPDATNSQDFNRYTYARNNPLKYTDPDGEIISSIITGVIGFVEAVVRSVAGYFVGFINPETGTNMINNAWNDYGKQMSNAWKIDAGLIKTDPNKSDGGRTWELISRFTWQSPQTLVGNIVMTGGNIAYQIQNVTYGYGMTAVDWGGKNAVTISNYSAGPRGYTADWRDHLFVHEYGHYIQSQQYGLVYLPTIGLPSLQSAILQTKNPDSPRHDDRWFEADASYKGAKYFDKHYGSGKDGYVAGSADYFDRNSFVNKGNSPYMNPRTEGYNYSGNPTGGTFHGTDIAIYIPVLGLIPVFWYLPSKEDRNE